MPKDLILLIFACYGALMKKLVIIFISLICFQPLAWADSLELSSGEFLSGNLKSWSSGRVIFESELLGRRTISTESVKAVQLDDPRQFVLESGQSIQAWLVRHPNGKSLFLIREDLRQKVLLSQITSIQSLNQQKTTSLGEKPFFDFWKSRFGLGSALQSGNSDQISFNAQSQVAYKGDVVDYVFNALGNYGYADSVKNTQQILADTQLNYKHSKRFYTLYLVEAEHDFFQDLNLRSLQNFGFGYTWINNENTLLQTEGSAGFQEEFFKNAPNRYSPLSKFKFVFNQQIGKRISWENELSLFPNWRDTNDFRFRFESNLYVQLIQNFSLGLGVVDRFDNAPQPGNKKNDLGLTASLLANF